LDIYICYSGERFYADVKLDGVFLEDKVERYIRVVSVGNKKSRDHF